MAVYACQLSLAPSGCVIARALPIQGMAQLDTTSFGGTPERADALLALVLAGRKTGTCWAARHGLETH
ncbi:MAG: hypothetical protein JWM33_2458, partial [Caulobacteraceae bacterium]|nr:hypothetical protein [Caulobacteraceae bacterium]